MTTHSALPWEAFPNNYQPVAGLDSWQIVGHDIEPIAGVNYGLKEANAAFIVTACNSHAANIARIAELEVALRASWRLLHDPDAEAADKVIAVIHKALKGTK